MHIIQQPNYKIGLIEVPEDATCIELDEYTFGDEWNKCILYIHNGYNEATEDLPEGDWELIGIYPELTEQQAEQLVEWKREDTEAQIKKAVNYMSHDKPYRLPKCSLSFHSLLTANNIDTNKRYAVLKSQ